jgi:hypothetical protein
MALNGGLHSSDGGPCLVLRHPTFLGRALVALDAYVKEFGTVTNWHRLFDECVRCGIKRGR